MGQIIDLHNKDLFIFCDTCIYYEDFELNNAYWKKIFTIISQHPRAKLLITRPLAEEIEKKLHEIAISDKEKIQNTLKKMRIKNVDSFLDLKALEHYQKKYTKNYIRSIGQRIRGRLIKTKVYPIVEIETIFLDAVSIRKPFTYNNYEGGYQKT